MRTFKLTVLALFLTSSQIIFAQTKPSDLWKFVPESVMASKRDARQITPQQYRTASLDVPLMKSLLAQTPMWQTPNAEAAAVVISLPMPDGKVERFRMMEAPVMHPDLQAQYPSIRSYAGVGIDDPAAYFRGDFTPRGFHGMVRSPEHSTVYIDPYSTADITNYQTYYRKDFSKDDPWQCHFDEIKHNHEHKAAPIDPAKIMAGDCMRRDYTLALACTGEYAVAVCAPSAASVTLVVAAFTTTMNRVNGVFEQDASVHMTLVANNNALIYLNGASDPYTNGSGGTMLSENQTNCDAVIGNGNYDIGHVFSTGGGGVAYLGAVCSNSIKAGGVTGSSSPEGDAFDIDYVAHEMGHQFGANHTFNNSCGGNRNSSTAYEPGSGSTIMSYAGICPYNIQAHSDDYFHAISVQEIAAEVTGQGNSCSTNTDVNDPPTANAGADYVIPKSTPFILTGTGTDPNGGDVLTYCWEQWDLGATSTTPPSSTQTTAPVFRSLKGTTSPSRYLPKLDSVLINYNPMWEVLPSVGRTLNFRLTVRDNRTTIPVGGCTAEDSTVVTVNGTAGPFLVTAPNLPTVTWPALSTQTVTWDVAGTTAAPVSCANVDIYLSVNGGLTYPHVLATATPNDGTQSITVPNIAPNSTARVMVKGAGNIFYDISNANFAITTPVNGFTLDVTPNSQSVCAPTSAVYNVAIGVSGTFSGNVTLSTTGVPAGANVSFSQNPVAAPGNSTLTMTTTGVAAGTYNFTVTGTSGAQTQSETVSLTVANGVPGQVVLVSPANGATGVSQLPTLTWNAATGASTYGIDVATDAAFSNIVATASGIAGTSHTLTTPLATNTTYYWRSRATNQCGNGAYSTTFSFTTANIACLTQASTDVPKAISGSGTPTVTSVLNITANGTISDVNLLNLGITHTYVNDLIVKLKSPANTEITLFSQICGSQDNVQTNFDNTGAAYNTLPCPPTNNGTYQPLGALSAFNGQNINGTWTLTVMDVANVDGGSLNTWSLNACYTPSTPRVVVTITGTNVSCNGGSNGTATATASGGNGSYSYAWTNGGTTATITGLIAGTYTCTVTSGSQSSSGFTTLTQPAVLLANVTGTNPSGGNNGTATSSPTGGTPPYTFFWSNGGTTPTITGLPAGTYTCTVTDANGCAATGSVTLTGGGTCTLQTINSESFETGFGIWLDGGADCARVNNAAYANTGTWSVQLRDNTGTSVVSTSNVDLAAYSQVVVTFSYITTGFASGEDFWLQVSTDGGVTYTTVGTWVAGTNFANNVRGNGSHIFNGGLNATTRFRIRCDASDDTDNVYVDDLVIASQTTDLLANVTGANPNGGNNGTATSNPTGSAAPYTYLWNNGGTSQTITGLIGGVYTCTVTSTGGCIATGSVTLTGGSCTPQTINSESFETGLGIWRDGGTDCARIDDAAYANTGTWSVQLRDNTNSSILSTINVNLASYNFVTVTFSYIATGFANGEDFWLQVSTDGGVTYTTVDTWVAGTNFTNDVRGTGTHTFNNSGLNATTRFRIRCDASDDTDNLYIDDAVIAGCTNSIGDPEVDSRFNPAADILASNADTDQLLAYPNPTNQTLNVEFSQSEGTATLVVMDLLGKTIQQQKVSSNGTGLQLVLLDVSSLQPGSYLLQVLDGKERRYVQFVKMGN